MSNQLKKFAAFVCSCADRHDTQNIVEGLEEAGAGPVFRHRTLCRSDGCQFVAEQLSEAEADGAVFAACTPEVYREKWSRQLDAAGLNRHCMTLADIKSRKNAADRRQVAVSALKSLQEIGRFPDVGDISVSQTVLVVGSAPGAMEAALQAADGGCDVVLVSPAEQLGISESERLVLLGESDDAGRCVDRMVESVTEHPGIEVLNGAHITAAGGQIGDFALTVRTGDGEDRVLRGGAVVVAAGLDIHPPGMDFDLEVGAEVTTQLGFRRRLTELSDFEHDERPDGPCIVFYVDEDDEDSPLAFSAAVHNAVYARRNVKCEVFVVCHQAKVALPGMDEVYRRARKAGVFFVKYGKQRPQVKIPEVPASFRTPEEPFYPLQISLPLREAEVVASAAAGETCRVNDDRLEIDCDCLVLSERLVASAATERLGRLLSIRGTESGYLQEDNVHLDRVLTNRRGVFAVGGSRKPCSLQEVMTDAQEAASAAVAMLSDGYLQRDWLSAHVSGEDCAFCLTCVRVCPHEAAVPDYSEGAARIDPQACQGCGSCAGECPAGAIELECYSKEAMFASAAMPKEWEDD